MPTVLRAMALAVLAALPAAAQETTIEVEAPWSRASLGTMRPGVAYMTLRNTGDAPATLTGIRSEAAAMPELHRSTEADGASSMEPVDEVTIAPGGTVALAPGGLHVMLMELTQSLEEGGTHRLTLIFEDGTEMAVEVPILPMSARGPAE